MDAQGISDCGDAFRVVSAPYNLIAILIIFKPETTEAIT